MVKGNMLESLKKLEAILAGIKEYLRGELQKQGKEVEAPTESISLNAAERGVAAFLGKTMQGVLVEHGLPKTEKDLALDTLIVKLEGTSDVLNLTEMEKIALSSLGIMRPMLEMVALLEEGSEKC